ncbi:hypothetical protein BX666DRAFT_166196 [Dichotomocladium elegans]|nr:hypothetical protein BX666DRAFT_166196 [Dichotomocladium elegans]
MMLDGLEDRLEYLPLLPYLLSNGKNKKKRNQREVLNEPMRDTLGCIKIRRDDNVDVEKKLQETIQRFRLNDDQASVLRQVARSVIIAPGWNEKADDPIILSITCVFIVNQMMLSNFEFLFLP